METIVEVGAPDPRPKKAAARAKRRAERAAPARARSASRRRRIQNEVRARQQGQKDVFELQQRLIGSEASEQLMEAARALLQPSDYECVTLERAVEGLCGFPSCAKPCSNADVAASGVGKQWAVNFKEREVYDAKLVGRFCSRECLRLSGQFALRLEPEPAYARPAAAVATSRRSVAEADEAALAAAKAHAAPEAGSGGEAGDAVAGGAADAAGNKPLPRVRPKAVVRFSREKQTYSVAYGDYDGGGALPDIPSPCQQAPDASAEPDTEAPAKAPPRTVTTKQLLAAPVVERAPADPAPQTVSFVEPAVEPPAASPAEGELPAPSASSLPADGNPSAEEIRDDAAKGEAEEAEDDEEVVDSEPEVIDGITMETGFLDDATMDAAVCEATRPTSGFPRAWGVLSGWMTDLARQILDGERLLRDFEETAQYASRRALLAEFLIDRVPGDFTWASQRVQDVVQALGVHQVLPPVTDVELYDLLALLLLEAVVLRHEFNASPSGITVKNGAFSAAPLGVRVQTAARALSIGDEELEVLRALLR